MPTIETRTYEINGVFDTGQTVMNNLATLTSAAGAWLTFDINTGKWSAIINRAGASVASFNDSNIIGGINVSGTGIDELYNAVKITFPNSDILDQMDVITLETPTGDRFPNEPDNVLEINYDCINDPMIAQMLAVTNLRQSRADKIIEFRTDYSKLGLKAGDVIDVTAEMYAYNAKKFRVTKVSEEDGTDNNILLSITALEYDEGVYDYTDLTLYLRDRANGIIPKYANPEVLALDNIATTASVSNALADPVNTTAADQLSANLTSYTNLPGLFTGFLAFDVALTQSVYAGFASTGGNYYLTLGFEFLHTNPNIPANQPWKYVQFNIEPPKGTFSYNVGTAKTTTGYFASYIYVYYLNRVGTSITDVLTNGTLLTTNTVGYQTSTVTWADVQLAPGYYYLVCQPKLFNDLSYGDITPTSYTTIAQGSGGGFTATGLVLE